MIVLTALEEDYMKPTASEHGAAACLGKPHNVTYAHGDALQRFQDYRSREGSCLSGRVDISPGERRILRRGLLDVGESSLRRDAATGGRGAPPYPRSPCYGIT